MKTFVDGEILTAADLNATLTAVQATYTGTLLAGAATGTKTTEIINLTTGQTSVSGGVYLDLSGWKGIQGVTVQPRNTDSTPLTVSVELVELARVLLRFGAGSGTYNLKTVPITMTIQGWK